MSAADGNGEQPSRQLALRPRAMLRAHGRVWVLQSRLFPPRSLRDAVLLVPMLLVMVLASVVLLALLAVSVLAAALLFGLAALGVGIHRARIRRG